MHRRQMLSATLLAFAAMPWVQNAQAIQTRFGTTKTAFAVNIETFRFGGAPVEERIAMVSELGFTGIEFWDWANKDIETIASLTSSLNLDVVQFVLRGFVNHPELHEPFLQNVRETIEVAKTLGVDQLTVIPGMLRDDLPREKQIEACIEGYKKAAPLCEDEEITLMLEPLNPLIDHKGVLVSRTDEAARIVREVGSPYIRILYDVYHQQITEGNLINTIEDYYRKDPLIHYFQIADTPGRNEPGTGEINYSKVLESIFQMGYRGYVGLELRPRTDEVVALNAVVQADQW